jgi:hypothetical protein
VTVSRSVRLEPVDHVAEDAAEIVDDAVEHVGRVLQRVDRDVDELPAPGVEVRGHLSHPTLEPVIPGERDVVHLGRATFDREQCVAGQVAELQLQPTHEYRLANVPGPRPQLHRVVIARVGVTRRL